MFRVVIPLPYDAQAQKQWDYVLSNFAPDEMYIVGDRADAPHSNVFKKDNVTYVDSPAEAPGPLWVFSPELGRYFPGQESLRGLALPEDITVVFGADMRFMEASDFEGAIVEKVVFIPTDTKDDMFSWVAYSVTAWHWRLQHG